MGASTRALRIAQLKSLSSISSRLSWAPCRLTTVTRNLARPIVCPFSSATRNAALKGYDEELDRLAKQFEEENERKRQRKIRKRVFWFFVIGIAIPGSIQLLSHYLDTKIWHANEFSPFTVVKRENVSSTSFILTVRPDSSPSNLGRTADPYEAYWERGSWSVEIKQPELQIVRSYTPLSPLKTDKVEDIRFLIRREPGGEVSGYLNRLSIGNKVFLRCPRTGVNLPQDVTDVVFLAGGTGIAPAMQIAYTLLERRKHEDEGEGPKIHIIWANRRREDCLGGDNNQSALDSREGQQGTRIVKELLDMQRRHPNQLFVEYVVDEERTSIDENRVAQLTKWTPAVANGEKLLIVSGPEGFINFLAGPKKWEDGQEKQGPIGGMLGRMNPQGWIVWKL